MGLGLAMGMLLGSGSAGAVTIDFEGLPSLSDVASASLPGVSISTALVVSEADANVLTGFDTSSWATSDVNGILNTYDATIAFDFSVPVTAFSVNVVGLPDGLGSHQQVLLQAYRGSTLVGLDISDPDALGDSGLAEALLSVVGSSIDRVVLSAVIYSVQNGLPCFEPGDVSSFFADDASFTPVPEPASAALVLAGLAALGARRALEETL
jgi:hypothetical protein